MKKFSAILTVILVSPGILVAVYIRLSWILAEGVLRLMEIE